MLTESLVFLALTVTVFRWSAVEGYMISTGSMATSLFGYHRRVTCPACGFEFAVGAPGPPHFSGHPPEGLIVAQDVSWGGGMDRDSASCPNCDLSDIDLSGLPVTEGDQILVHKDAFLWRQLLRGEGPRRWEVAVFRNPEDPLLTYVKRVVGLPGETIEIQDGDVYADGRLQRKPFSSQLGTRVLVHANDHEPAGDPEGDWEPRWLIDGPDSRWEWRALTFEMLGASAGADTAAADVEWVHYEHWIRQGGTHTTSAPLDRWPDDVAPPDPLFSTVEFEADQGRLACYGALPAALLARWTTLSHDEQFLRTVRSLYRRSHVAPVTDEMSYNAGLGRDAPSLMTDFMVDLTVTRDSGEGTFVVEMTDGVHVCRTEIDFGAGEARLWFAGEDQPRAVEPLPDRLFEGDCSLQMSTFDRQVLLAVDEELLLGPAPLPLLDGPAAGVSRPARFGARGLDVRVAHISLYRDVHYVAGENNGGPFELGADEFFVLGDNSSVSVDGRHWDRPGVSRELLVGKPLLVHLPSRSQALNRGASRRYIRVPDFSRIRYIR